MPAHQEPFGVRYLAGGYEETPVRSNKCDTAKSVDGKSISVHQKLHYTLGIAISHQYEPVIGFRSKCLSKQVAEVVSWSTATAANTAVGLDLS